MPVQIEVKESFAYRGDLAQLKEFVTQAEAHGLTEFTWSSYAGDQREPSQLILTARG